MSKQTIVIYHGNCQDGFTAAWVAWRKFGDSAEYVPAKYGDAPPDVAGKDVLIVDFSYKRDTIVSIAKSAKSLTIFDHHRTAQSDLQPIIDELSTVRTIQLSNGELAYVDESDLSNVSKLSWSKHVRGGAIAYIGGGREDPRMSYMHRMILDAKDGVLVDHVNRNDLDNRRSNLRPATRQQNAANMDRGSVLKGITRRRDKWVAQITVNGELKYLGIFESDIDAAKAYDEAARKEFGQFARCNFGETCDPIPVTTKIVFDMDRSGAGITWDILHTDRRFEHSDSPSWLVDYVEDRDLWRFRLPRSKEINAFLSAQKMTFARWDEIARMDFDVIVKQGEAVLAFLDRYVEEMGAQARHVDFCGYNVPIVNAPYLSVSELCGALAEGQPFAMAWFQRGDGKIQYSLRSRGEGAVDVSEIAKRFGGGGHRNAAGFVVDKPMYGFEAERPNLVGAERDQLLRRALDLLWYSESRTLDDEMASQALCAKVIAAGLWKQPDVGGLEDVGVLTRAIVLIEKELPGLADGVGGEGDAILKAARERDLYPGKKS